MEMGINGRAALVCGASKGIGRGVALGLAAEGVRIAAVSRGGDPLVSLVDEIIDSGGEAVGIEADLSSSAGCEVAWRDAEDAFGRIDILFVNTGGPPSGPSLEFDDAEWLTSAERNILPLVRLSRLAAPGMKERAWGRIIALTSASAKAPIDGLILSNASRAAVHGIAKTLSNELGPFGVTVNCLAPGFTMTGRLEELMRAKAERDGVAYGEIVRAFESQAVLGRLGRVEEIASAAVYLASEKASFITGQAILVDGGLVKSLP